MVDPIHIGLLTVPEHFIHLHSRHTKTTTTTTTTAIAAHPTHDYGDLSTMPIIGGHKTLSSLLHLSGSTSGGANSKSDGRAAFSPYTGSLSEPGGPRDARGAGPPDTEPGLGAPPALSLGTSITLNIRYVAKDMWRKVTFPPGVTVTQARDICMLRFNVWQQTLASNEALEPAARDQEQPPVQGPRRGTAGAISPTRGATAGFTGSAATGGGPQGQSELRELYGLFWTSAGHWLEADEMLGTYPLRKGEVLELQHIVDFIPLLPHEFRFSYAEGYLYHLRPGSKTSSGGGGDSGDSSRSSWRLCWAVLRGCVLRIHRQKGQLDPDVEIDLAHPFRLSDQDGRSWPRPTSKSASADAAAIQSLIEGLPGDPAGDPASSAAPGGGGVLVIHSPADARQVHVFRTCNVFDYDTWHRTLRHMASSAGGGAGAGSSSMSGSVSISGASNISNGGPSAMDAGAGLGDPPPTPGGGAAGPGLAVALSPQISHRLRPSSTRHEGYVNRKQPNGYGFRRRYCVLLPTVLYGFLHGDDCTGVAEADMPAKCEFAVALDPSNVTIEAISWNGRYLLRVFGPDSMSLRDKPGATALQPAENSRIQCTDILATAAQAAIEQYGSTFGMLPDARELVRLMIEDGDEGQTWAVAFNSIAGLPIIGQSKVIIGARRTTSLGETKSHMDLKNTTEYHAVTVGRAAGATAAPDDRDYRAPTSAKQQSLSEFIVSQVGPGSSQAALAAKHQSPPAPRQPLPPVRRPEHTHAPASGGRSSTRGVAGDEAKAAPRWIPLSIDKYVKEDEERKRGYDGPGNDSMSMLHASDDASDVDPVAHQGYANDYEARPPARFNWFKRRGSTSK